MKPQEDLSDGQTFLWLAEVKKKRCQSEISMKYLTNKQKNPNKTKQINKKTPTNNRGKKRSALWKALEGLEILLI